MDHPHISEIGVTERASLQLSQPVGGRRLLPPPVLASSLGALRAGFGNKSCKQGRCGIHLFDSTASQVTAEQRKARFMRK